MIILVCSKISQASIQASLGKPEYSYYFLLKEFLPALERIAQIEVLDSVADVDSLYRQYTEAGEAVLFLSVSPPHQTPVGLDCPTLCLFAWEFDSLPDEPWDDEPRNDWRYVFRHIAGAICTSRESQHLVEREAPGFPIAAIPAPVWNHYAHLAEADGHLPLRDARYFSFTGYLIDSAILGLSADGLVPETAHLAPESNAPNGVEPAERAMPEDAPGLWALSKQLYQEWRNELALPRASRDKANGASVADDAAVSVRPAVPAGVLFTETPLNLQVTGVVYTTLLNPADSRKNWTEIIAAFCWAFKDEAEATLVVKMTHYDLEYYRIVLITLLSRLSPFKCRVLVVHGFLEEGQYQELIKATSYYVNASSGEGLCLPLMEFLSAGCPALAPTHTAMADYIQGSLAFTVDCSREPFCWPHDPSGVYMTHRHRLNWASLVAAFRESFRVVREEPERYRSMSKSACARLQGFASQDQVARQLSEFIQALDPSRILDKRQNRA
ncbi:glycosyltransferase [Pseudomonas sp. CAU 1711]|uniref:glycosyltransferase n=1 Tax=Pseudomonas sp. CAU 1711 TaxID=3140356 RepID=UPI00326025DA